MLLLVLFVSCSNYVNENKGYIKVSLPNINRKTIDSNSGMINSNCYELVVYSNTFGRMNFAISSESDNTIEVPIGSYSILVLAGVDNTNYPNMMNKVALLGTGEVNNVIVESHKETYVNITLSPIQIDLIGPEKAVKGNHVNFKFLFDSKNENIYLKSTSIGAYTYGLGEYIGSKVEKSIDDFVIATTEPTLSEQIFYLYPEPIYFRFDYNRACDKVNSWKYDWITPYGIMSEFSDEFNNMFGNLKEKVMLVEYQLIVAIGW
jgi:hypothetical protein